MNTVYFDNMELYDDLNLLLLKKTIGTPKPKIDTLDIPGSSVPIDFTEFFGDVQYNSVKLKFEVGTFKSLEEVFSIVKNKLNGRKLKIRLSDDPNYYYVGRVTISDWSLDKILGKFTIEAECEPYKYKINVTEIIETVTTSKTVIINNDRMWVVPTVKTTAPIKIRFENMTADIDKGGEYTIPELQFKDGENSVILEGNATVTFTYQEGSL